jgi:hypothetical protein
MSGYIGTQPVPQATQTRDSFTCTAGQTSFATSGYTPSFLDVYLNGIKLAAADYTASNGSDVVLASGAALDDILEVVAYSSFEVVTDTVTNAGTVLNLDRTGSDGTILDLKKDGTTVGSIGVYSSDNLYLQGKSDHSGLAFGEAEIYGFRNGSENDGVTSLGSSAGRFKDLYLSGGVYLGGTGSANKLDDYEEGTWTPTLVNGFSSVTYASTNGWYVKVGGVVHFNARISYSSATRSALRVHIEGLPYTSLNDSGQSGNAYFGYVSAVANTVQGYISANGTKIELYIDGSSDLLASSCNSNGLFHVSGSYPTSS